jgi:hypothetical protein
MKHRNVRKVGYAPAVAAVSSVFSTLSPFISAASAVMSGVSFFQQKKATSQAAAATKQQSELQSRLNDINARRQMIAQQREARIRRAQITTETTGAGLGLPGTSSSVGAIGAVTTQEASNISNIQQQGDFGRAIGSAGTAAYTAMGEAKGWSDMGTVSGKLFDLSGGFDSMKKIGSIFG